MLEDLRQHWQSFRSARPGERFYVQYQRRHDPHASVLGRVLRLSLGVFVTAAGLVLMPAPGPGMLIVAVGLSLLAHESAQVARALDWAELRLRPPLRRALRAWRRLPWPAQLALVLAGLLLAIAGGYLMLLWWREG